ncbi:DAZ interacting protein 1-like [Planoprotostelium fungivorum]|uniref:DAZ interacting protein 1-like n=1 Tax=Planoprotostelium fungivorum TaxID=1890364 RepID=A0A2P6NXL8_9EUKA|nr:DAZ interacting protein 1-like [Planoprotostelium fungivorum]
MRVSLMTRLCVSTLNTSFRQRQRAMPQGIIMTRPETVAEARAYLLQNNPNYNRAEQIARRAKEDEERYQYYIKRSEEEEEKRIERGGTRSLLANDNPFADSADKIVHKLMKRHGILPEWVERNKRIHETVKECREILRAVYRQHLEYKNYVKSRDEAEKARRLKIQIEEARKAQMPWLFRTYQNIRSWGEVKSFQETEKRTKTLQVTESDWAKSVRNFSDQIRKVNALTESYNSMVPWAAQLYYNDPRKEVERAMRDVEEEIEEEKREFHQKMMNEWRTVYNFCGCQISD